MQPFRPLLKGEALPFSNPGCYARVLNDCSPKLSGEHYFTYEILRRITKEPQGVYLRGAPWQPDGVWLQPESATANVLCERHNGALSPLDAFASELHSELDRIYSAAERRSPLSTIARFYGPNLERWLMKTLCGFACARPTQAFANAASPTLPEDWVRFLFGHADLVPPAGFYLSGAVGEMFSTRPDQFTVMTITAKGFLSGVMIQMCSVPFTLLAMPWNGRFEGLLHGRSVRRPRAMLMNANSAEWRVDFAWPDGAGPAVSYAFDFSEGAA